MENKFIPPNIYNNDVVLPLFTEELREHLKKSIFKEREEARLKMLEDGWGKTKFGEPNPEFYGDTTVHFWIQFGRYLDDNFEVKEEFKMSNVLVMRVVNATPNEFGITALNHELVVGSSYKYFQGFKFSTENYGIDFYKMGHN